MVCSCCPPWKLATVHTPTVASAARRSSPSASQKVKSCCVASSLARREFQCLHYLHAIAPNRPWLHSTDAWRRLPCIALIDVHSIVVLPSLRLMHAHALLSMCRECVQAVPGQQLSFGQGRAFRNRVHQTALRSASSPCRTSCLPSLTRLRTSRGWWMWHSRALTAGVEDPQTISRHCTETFRATD